MARVQRFDVGTLNAPRETPQGFLLLDGYASRVGTYDYIDQAGNVRKELRRPEDVFDPASLETFMGAPFTDDHPLEFVTLLNAEGVQIGTVLMPGRQDGDYVAVTVVVTDAAAIEQIRAGKRELSVGYTVEHIEGAGVDPTYGPYDARQTKIIVNHLALVDEGRAGPVAALRFDAARSTDTRFQVGIPADLSGTVLADRAGSGQHARSIPMANKKDTDPNMPPAADAPGAPAAPAAPAPAAAPAATAPSGDLMALMNQLVAANARIEELLKQLATSETAETEAEGRATQAEASAQNAASEAAAATTAAADAKARADKAVEDANAAVEARVDARVKLLTDANTVLGRLDAEDKPIDRRAMSDRDIKLAIIKHVDNVDVPETEKRDAYIDALVDGAIGRHARGLAAGENALNALADAGKHANPNTDATSEGAAAKQLRDRTASAWKTPATKKGQ